LEEVRKKITKPLLDEKRDIDSAFKKYEEMAKSHEDKINAKVCAWHEAEQQKALEASNNNQTSKLSKPIMMDDRIRATQGAVGTVKKVLKWKIVDEKVLPRRCLSPDMKKIDDLVKAGKVPKGVETYEESNLSVR